MSNVHTALVVGGGIAGPVAAMALQKAGIAATVYEAYGSTADRVGGALSIAPNGQNALAVIGAAEAVRRVGEPMTAMAGSSTCPAANRPQWMSCGRYRATSGCGCLSARSPATGFRPPT